MTTRTVRHLSSLSLILLAACSVGRTETLPPESGKLAAAKSSADSPIKVAPVAEQKVSRALVTGGRVSFDDLHVAHVFSPVTGRVLNITAALGAHVRKGAVLATISSPDLSLAVADEDKAKADVAAADRELQRQKELAAAGAGVQREYEAALGNAQKARAELNRAQAKSRLLSSGGAGRQAFTLTAPIDGEIIARSINPGAEVQGQYSGGTPQELFTIGKLDRVWVLADVHEQDLARVKVGTAASIALVAYPGKAFTGHVDWVSGTLDPTTRTARVRCTLENADGLLKPEMYATVSFETDGRETVAVPRSAVLHMGDKTVVYVAQNTATSAPGHYERRPVIVDEDESGEWLPVLHGVGVGENIVTSGAVLLSDSEN
jgi:cobalt-zinc-cadmium efflux system membrane fusion protein